MDSSPLNLLITRLCEYNNRIKQDAERDAIYAVKTNCPDLIAAANIKVKKAAEIEEFYFFAIEQIRSHWPATIVTV